MVYINIGDEYNGKREKKRKHTAVVAVKIMKVKRIIKIYMQSL